MVATLRAAPGDTFTPTDSYLAALANSPPHLHEMAVRDVMRGPQERDHSGACTRPFTPK